MNKLIVTIFLIQFTYSAFIEQGDLSNKTKLQMIPSFSTSENLHSEILFYRQFDIVTYNNKGDWASILYNPENDILSLTFYNIEDDIIQTYEYGDQKFNNNEGDLGVSITTTNQPNEVFIAVSYERNFQQIGIVGAIINVNGEMQRQDDWITIFSSNQLNYMNPRVQHCGDYIYVTAYTAYHESENFYGEGDDHWGEGEGFDFRNLLTKEEIDDLSNSFLGYIAFNSIDISGNTFLQDNVNLEGTIIKDSEDQYITIYYEKNIEITKIDGNKGVVVFAHNIDTESISYFVVDNGIPSTPVKFDTTSDTEPAFQKTDDLISVSNIPTTSQFTITYSDRQSSQTLFISTIDSTDNSIVCHNGILYEDYFQNFNLQDSSNNMNPSVINISTTLGYVSYQHRNVQNQRKYFISQFNPSTCQLYEQIAPAFATPNSINSNEFQQIKYLKNSNQNKLAILHAGAISQFQTLEYTLLWLQSMMNCDAQDETNNLCTSCQEGFILTHDGQCIIPNCAMDCTQYGLNCNINTNTCEECTQSSHCSQNENGHMCLNFTCQNTCYKQEDCGQISQFCNFENNQCQEELVISDNIQKIELLVPETIPIIEANNEQTGLLELSFEIEDLQEKQYWLQFLKISLNDSDIFPLKTVDKKGAILITLPRNTYNGIGNFIVFANKLVPTSNNFSRRQLLDGFTSQQIYMEKTLRIVDSSESQIEYQEKVVENKEEEISITKKVLQKEQQTITEQSHTVVYVLVPIMIIGFIGLPILGFILGKKQAQKPKSIQNNNEIANKNEIDADFDAELPKNKQ